jgi:hypothetical protein
MWSECLNTPFCEKNRATNAFQYDRSSFVRWGWVKNDQYTVIADGLSDGKLTGMPLRYSLNCMSFVMHDDLMASLRCWNI